MKYFTRKRRWPILGGIVLLFILVLCAWIYGWGRGDIMVIEFSANEVDRIDLSCTDTRVDLHKAVVTEKKDIQALIDSVNSFQHTGSSVKDLFRYGIGAGGTVLYEYYVYLSNGDTFSLTFASNNGEQELSDMEVTFWANQSNEEKLFPDTCKGSMELFYELYNEYRTTE